MEEGLPAYNLHLPLSKSSESCSRHKTGRWPSSNFVIETLLDLSFDIFRKSKMKQNEPPAVFQTHLELRDQLTYILWGDLFLYIGTVICYI
jgi:hypothetical protein